VSDVLDLLPELKRRQDRHQALRLRIDRRARELAARVQEAYFRAMVFEIYAGRLAEELVPFWEPIAGDVSPRHEKRA
jgi:HEPN domain-containing protein